MGQVKAHFVPGTNTKCARHHFFKARKTAPDKSDAAFPCASIYIEDN
jgi:hypothetical protein